MKAIFAALFALCTATAGAAEVHIAVAANFSGPMQVIAPLFERASGHRATLSFGATGKFYAQITNGAPYDVLLAADDETPARLVREKQAVDATAFTYAIGRLVLWSARPDLVDARGEVLRRGGFKHLALANPKTAPYGQAAMQVMTRMAVADALKPSFVQGENIAQTHQFISTGAAELGFVAYSQVIRNDRIGSGSGWIVPAELHDPIRQDAVLLARARDKPAARAFLDFLRGEAARSVIRSFGYELR
ncbi:MAG: molybdate ABC transporter substrate-binding protein [Betaproteobacteria bacterium]|nr:molybdate ABC transporter substrate-binding protein [Betaproteobacteria bacterium]